MLSGIGIIIILKPNPHALGYDKDYEGNFSFVQPDGHNTLSEAILYARLTLVRRYHHSPRFTGDTGIVGTTVYATAPCIQKIVQSIWS